MAHLKKSQYFQFLCSINLPVGHVRSHTIFGPDLFSRFDVYWLQTNKQTDTPNLYIDTVYRSTQKINVDSWQKKNTILDWYGITGMAL